MNAIPDHYAALGIDPTADPEVIAAAYRALAKKYHPDTGATTGTASAERFEQIQQAYEVLRSPESRRQYDLELLAQTERDLEAHLARKRRALPGVAGVPPGTPGPDLGAIRPESAAAGPQGSGPTKPGQPRRRRAVAPFLIPAALLLVLLGAAVWLFLPRPFDASPVTMAEKTTTSAAPATPPQPPAAKPAATPAVTAPAEATVQLEDPQQPPVKADAEPMPSPTPLPASADGQDAATAPVFGSSETAEAPAEPEPGQAPVPPPPAPKPRPVKQKPPAAAPAATPRQQQADAGSGYTLIIFERRRRGRIITEQADMFFASRGSCIEFGVKAVLRRMEARNMNPRRQRIWYECQPAS